MSSLPYPTHGLNTLDAAIAQHSSDLSSFIWQKIYCGLCCWGSVASPLFCIIYIWCKASGSLLQSSNTWTEHHSAAIEAKAKNLTWSSICNCLSFSLNKSDCLHLISVPFFYPSDCIPQNQFPSALSPSNENILMILFYFSFLPLAGLSADSSFDSDLHPRRSDQAHHLSSQEPAAASVRTEELWVCLPHPWGESQRSSPTLQQHLHSVPEDSGESQTGTGWCCCVFTEGERSQHCWGIWGWGVGLRGCYLLRMCTTR